MDERELWELFYETGLPMAYAALAELREERLARQAEQARTAFQPRIEQV